MGIDYGWVEGKTIESIWYEDSALDGITPGAFQDWLNDAEASHLRPFAKKGQPAIIELRTLRPDEEAAVRAYFKMAASDVEAGARAALLAFRIGVSFQGMGLTFQTPDGIQHPVTVKERGLRMLSEPFVKGLAVKYQEMIPFYGAKIINATMLTELEKKASSPPSTQTPSSEAATSTPDTTGESPKEPAA